MVGACIGFVGIIGVRVLVLGDSFDGLHSKFAETGMLETVGVSLLAILILLFSIFLQVLLHEGGHLVCGLATGYRFVSFRIFNLTFIRKDGKLCIKRFSLAGTGGQCLLTPPERPLEDIPTTLYNLGGVLANLLTAILAFLPLLTVDGLPYLLKFFLLMLSLIGILLAGMNGIPMKMGGIGNDADNMCLLLYTDELDTYIRQYKDVTSSKQRLLCALALYRDKDTAKAKEIYEATCQRKNKYLMQGEVSSDIALMKSILTAKNAL